MKLLITGCAGFIGINFIKYWLNRHAEDTLVGVDCLTYAANKKPLQKLVQNPNFIFYKTDICDRTEIDRIFQTEKPNTVVNFAAESHVDRSIQNPDIFLKTNVLGTQVLLDACLRYGVERYHQISTDEVYGDLPLESGEPFTESSPLKPSSPYSTSKAAADLLVLAYYKTYGLPITISRSSNNYGKYQHAEKFIPNIIKRAGEGIKILIYGDGKNVRDWLYVNDHCSAIDMILQKGKIGEIYNIGGDNEMPNLVLAKKILSILKTEIGIQFVEDRKGHDRRYSLNSQKIKKLGWKPRTLFDEGLTDTVKWYLKE
ncbi:MAG: dTDP-glucose 4,6-dehydratase [Clostridia bacterium]|nr:dTDP-glucose 4,6-dehydratase [Clostridia bacterium]